MHRALGAPRSAAAVYDEAGQVLDNPSPNLSDFKVAVLVHAPGWHHSSAQLSIYPERRYSLEDRIEELASLLGSLSSQDLSPRDSRPSSGRSAWRWKTVKRSRRQIWASSLLFSVKARGSRDADPSRGVSVWQQPLARAPRRIDSDAACSRRNFGGAGDRRGWSSGPQSIAGRHGGHPLFLARKMAASEGGAGVMRTW